MLCPLKLRTVLSAPPIWIGPSRSFVWADTWLNAQCFLVLSSAQSPIDIGSNKNTHERQYKVKVNFRGQGWVFVFFG